MSYYIEANKDPICASKRAYYVNYNSGINILGGSGSFQPYQRLYGYNNHLKYALGANVFEDGGYNTMRPYWNSGCCCNTNNVSRFSWGQYSGIGYNGPVDRFSWPTFPAQQNQTFATLGFGAFNGVPITTYSGTFASMGFEGFGYNPYMGCGCDGGYFPGYNYAFSPTNAYYYGYGYPTNTAANGYAWGTQGSYTYDGQANAWNRKGYATADASGAFIQDNFANNSTNINLGGLGKVAYSDNGKAISALGGMVNYSSIYGMKSIDLSTLINNAPAIWNGISSLMQGSTATANQNNQKLDLNS